MALCACTPSSSCPVIYLQSANKPQHENVTCREGPASAAGARRGTHSLNCRRKFFGIWRGALRDGEGESAQGVGNGGGGKGGSNVKLRCSVGGSESDTSGMADKKMEER